MANEFPTKDKFRDQLGSMFSARISENETVGFELTEVDSVVSNERQENFTLLFRAPNEVAQVQGIFELANPTLGEMSVFLVPVKREADGLYFEAVFNHLL